MTDPRPQTDDTVDSVETLDTVDTVETAAVLLCVNGGLALLSGVYVLAAYSLGWLGLLLVLTGLAVAGAQIRVGVLVRRHVPAARTAGIVSSVVAVLLAFPTESRGPVWFVLHLLLAGATVYLLYHRDTLRVFPSSGRPLRL